MRMILSIFAFLLILTWVLGHPRPAPMPSPADTVILVTLDGVRVQELLDGVDNAQMPGHAGAQVMPRFMKKIVPKGVFIGDRSRGSLMHMGNPSGISMSGYQAIFGGRATPCLHNDCAPLFGETILSRVAQHLGAPAIFTSYGPVCHGIRATPYAQPAICGPPMAYNLANELGLPVDLPRDDVVALLALRQLRTAPPPLLFIGLEESDATAHGGNYRDYLNVLERYELILDEIWQETQRLNSEGHKTSLIISIDHGRGRGNDWTGHRWNIPGTSEVWAFAAGYGIAAKGRLHDTVKRSLFDIRPTVEHLLGLTPRHSIYGGVIEEFLRP